MSITLQASDEYLRQLATDIFAGHVFTDRQVNPPSLLSSVFLPLTFISDEQKQQILDDPPGLIYEHLSKAMSRSLNDMPIFMSCQFLSKDDTKKVTGMVKQLQQAAATLTPQEDA